MNINLSDEILNVGLKFSMEFGENWLVDIDDRLANLYPEISVSDLRVCDKLCRKINKIAHSYISENPIKKDNKLIPIDISEFKNFMLERYDWIDDENMSRLYSQSCYYSLK